uniref:SCO family protein n=1 Tax=Thaumasiovibrio occultus TaxID=1891184 RepID=UPI000B3563BA|nr:SCO family protein [Thaumasiovibrio occultus]
MKKIGFIAITAFVCGLIVSVVLRMDSDPSKVPLRNAVQQIQLVDSEDPRLRVIYFGFTHCPDVCPTSLAVMAAALNALPDNATPVLPLFISLDPERDTPTKSDEYAKYFHPSIVGVSASLNDTRKLATHLGVLYAKSNITSELSYSIDHSSFFYLVGPDGQLRDKVPHTLNPNQLVEAIMRQ